MNTTKKLEPVHDAPTEGIPVVRPPSVVQGHIKAIAMALAAFYCRHRAIAMPVALLARGLRCASVVTCEELHDFLAQASALQECAADPAVRVAVAQANALLDRMTKGS